MKKQVLHYAVSWDDDNNTGTIAIHLEGGKKKLLNIDSAAEMAAVGVVLSQRPLFYDTDQKILKSGWEPASEND